MGCRLQSIDVGNRRSRSGFAFGLTGGIASGKSTVARYFQDLGACIIDADHVGHEMIEPGKPAYQEILRHFGNDVLNSSGQIDRKKLGPIVFADPHQLHALNAIVHPRIVERVDELAGGYYAANPQAVVIVDAALIFESGIGGSLRKVIVAWCRPEQQVERLMAKTEASREEAERRIRAQIPVEEKLRRADYTIDCSGSMEETRLQVERLFEDLKQLAEHH
jgi:dephospho-CoA kinase